MKTILLSAVLFPTLYLCSLSAQGTVLFYEDFESYALGGSGSALWASSGNWYNAGGGAANFIIAEDPDDALKKSLRSNVDNASPTTLARITSKEEFSIGTGLQIDFSMTLDMSNGGLYSRIGLITPGDKSTSFDKEFYMEVRGTQLSSYGDTSNPKYVFQTGEFVNGQTYEYSWRIIPLSGGLLQIQLYQDNILRIDNIADIANLPFGSDDDNIRLYIGFRNEEGKAIDSYVNWISVTAVPEPAHAGMLLLGGLALLGIAIRIRSRRDS